MSTKTQNQSKNESRWRYYAAFDDSDAYQRLLESLREMPGFQEGQYELCPDGIRRMVIEVKKEMYSQIESALLDGQKTQFKKMMKRTPDGDFEFVPLSNPEKIRVSESLFQVIRGTSFYRQLQRKAAKNKTA